MKGIEDIVKKHFSRSLLGYDIKEVDLFLDEIIAEMERLEGERRELMSAMDSLLDELEEYDALQAEAIRVKNGILPQPKKEIPAPEAESAAEAETAEEKHDTPAEDKALEQADDGSSVCDEPAAAVEKPESSISDVLDQAPNMEAGIPSDVDPDREPEHDTDEIPADRTGSAELEDRPADPAPDGDAGAALDPDNGTELAAAVTEN